MTTRARYTPPRDDEPLDDIEEAIIVALVPGLVAEILAELNQTAQIPPRPEAADRECDS